MEWLRSLIRKAAALFSRGTPFPAENTAVPAEVPEREKETLIPETRQTGTLPPTRLPGNELKSFETLRPGERRAPIAYSPDPLPTQDRKGRKAAVPGVSWEPDDSGNVILGRDDRFREQEREVQEVFTRYKGRYGTYVPGNDEPDVWEDDEEDEAEEARVQPKSSVSGDKSEQMSFDFDRLTRAAQTSEDIGATVSPGPQQQ